MTEKYYPAADETVFSEKLPNGLEIRVMPKKDYARTYVCLGIKYGGCDTRFRHRGELVEAPPGTAHFIEHKLFEMPDGADAMNEMARAGGSADAFTDLGATCYSFECTENFEENLHMLLGFVTSPCFTEQGVERERGIIRQEILMGLDNPERVCDLQLRQGMYPDHPAGNDVAGSLESVSAITPQILDRCYRAFYNPSNMFLTAAGCVEPEKVIAIAGEYFTDAGEEPPQRDYGPEDVNSAGSRVLTTERPVELPVYMLGVRLVPIKEPQAYFREIITAQLAMELLCGPSSPLYARLYEDGVINDSFYCGADDFGSVAFLYAGGEGAGCEALADELAAEAKRITEKGIDEALFSRIKKAAIGGFLRDLNNPECCSLMLADGAIGDYDSVEGLDILGSVTSGEAASLIGRYIIKENIYLSQIVNGGDSKEHII